MKSKRILSILLTLCMLFSLVPMSVFADGTATTVIVSFSAQGKNAFLCAPRYNVEVTSNLAEDCGYIDNVTNGVSALDVLVMAHGLMYGTEFTTAPTDYLEVSSYGYVNKLFGIETTANGFAVNNDYPYDPNSNYGNYGYTGTTVNTEAVSDGDYVAFFIYQDATTYSDFYTYFKQNNASVTEVNATVNEALTVNLEGFAYMSGSFVGDDRVTKAFLSGISGAQLETISADTGEKTQLTGITTDSDGNVSLTFDTAGTYYVTASGMTEGAVTDYNLMSLGGEPAIYGTMDFTTYESYVAYTEKDYGAGPYPADEIKYVDFVKWNNMEEGPDKDAYHTLQSNLMIKDDCPIVKPMLKVVVEGEQDDDAPKLNGLTLVAKGSGSADSFNAETYIYDVTVNAGSNQYVEVTAKFDEDISATLTYDAPISLTSDKKAYVQNLTLGKSIAKLTLSDKEGRSRVYTININTMRDANNTLGEYYSKISVNDADLYIADVEGSKLEDEIVTSNWDDNKNYYAKLAEGIGIFTATIVGDYTKAHIRYSCDDGETWNEFSDGTGGTTDLIKIPESGKAKLRIQILSDNDYYWWVHGWNGKNSKINEFVIWIEGTYIDADNIDFEGNGTENNPYLLKTATDFDKLDNLVTAGNDFAGKYFKIDSDSNEITLNEAWNGIGYSGYSDGAKTKDYGPTMQPFSGILDGNGEKLIFLNGSQPLFDCVREATIKNIEIFGEYIANDGLIANYVRDQGADGSDSIGDTGSLIPGIPDTADIENITIISGTNIAGSGIIGGYASGSNVVNIKNCVVQDGVKVGMKSATSREYNNNIGGIAGELNGSIIGSTCSATVYGNDFTGGICANMGQSMGGLSIIDCVFNGTVDATSSYSPGKYVGGILGAGYGGTEYGFTANAKMPTVRNCLMSGKVLGGSYIGGILGAEPGTTEVWCNGIGYIENNLVTGIVVGQGRQEYVPGTGYVTLSPENVGGVIGYMKSLNRYQVIENNYYLTGKDQPVSAIGAIASIASDDHYGRTDEVTSCTDEKLAKGVDAVDAELIAELNSNINSSNNWVLNDGIVSFSDNKHIVCMTTTPALNTETEQSMEQDDDFSDYSLILTYSDGTTETVNAASAIVSGMESIGYQLVSLTYNNHRYVFGAEVEESESSGDGEGGATPSNTITVKFTLLGDSIHGEGGTSHTLKKNNLEAWIAQTSVTLPKNSKVIDMFAKVLNQNGYRWINSEKENSTSGNYISSITTPDGETLAEFTNGPRSGWMYTLNGEHTNLGVSQQKLKDGDRIVFHYTDDYTAEKSSGSWSSLSGTTTKKDETATDTSTDVKTETTISGNTANAVVSESNITNAITEAKKDNASEIVISSGDTKKADTIKLEIPANSVKEIAESKDLTLTVATNAGDVAISNEILNAIVEQSGNKESLNVVIETKTADETIKNTENITEVVSQEALENATIVKVTITSGNTTIRTFGGHRLSVDVPVDGKKHEKGKFYKVHIISADGSVETTYGECIEKNGKLSVRVATKHLSSFVVTDIETAPFIDIPEHWAYESIKYAYNNSIMQGVDEGVFAPDDTMTRAMLVTVLYRLENEPAINKSIPFVDVKVGEWYANAVTWAQQNGIVSGVSETEFAPNEDITREQMAAILYRYVQYKKQDTSIGENTNILSYDDAFDISEYAIEALQWTCSAGIMKGETESTINPQGNCTRAQVATILMRYLEM